MGPSLWGDGMYAGVEPVAVDLRHVDTHQRPIYLVELGWCWYVDNAVLQFLTELDWSWSSNLFGTSLRSHPR